MLSPESVSRKRIVAFARQYCPPVVNADDFDATSHYEAMLRETVWHCRSRYYYIESLKYVSL